MEVVYVNRHINTIIFTSQSNTITMRGWCNLTVTDGADNTIQAVDPSGGPYIGIGYNFKDLLGATVLTGIVAEIIVDAGIVTFYVYQDDAAH